MRLALPLALLLLAPLAAPAGATTSGRPLEIDLAGPSRIEVGGVATYEGRVRLAADALGAAVGLPDQRVDIILDGIAVAALRTDGDGKFRHAVALAAGDHEVFARVAPGPTLVRESLTVATRAYILPPAPRNVSAEFVPGYDLVTVHWESAPAGAWPAYVGFRVYRAPCACPDQEVLAFDVPVPDVAEDPFAVGYSAGDADLRANTTHRYRIVAYSSEGEGAAATTTATTPAGMIDDIEVVFLGFRVCDEQGQRCTDAGENAQVVLQGASAARIDARWTGTVLSAGVPVTGQSVATKQSVRATGLGEVSYANATTDERGLWSEVRAVQPVALPTDGCRALSFHLAARTPHEIEFGHARLTVCG